MIGFPLFASNSIPRRGKIFIVLAFSVLMMPTVPASWSSSAALQGLDMYKLIFILGNDLLLGLTVSLVVFMTMQAAAMAGQMMSTNIGLAMSSQFDPSTESSASVLGILLTQTFVILFLTLNLHHDYIRVIGLSFQKYPPGAFIQTDTVTHSVIALGTQIFAIGFQIALPIIALVMFLNVALGLMTKFGQDFQVLMLSFPIRLGAGLMITVAAVPVIIYVFKQINFKIIENMTKILGL